jgi:hypothetical protein
VQLVAVLVTEELADLLRLQVHLAEQHGVTHAPVHVRPQVADDLVRIVQRTLDHERDGVHAEPGQPLLEPEPHHLRELVAHRRVGQVEVGLVLVEAVLVVLPGLAVERPRGRLLVREHHGAGLLRRPLVPPHVEVPIRGVGGGAGGLEPRVRVGRVVHDEVDDHADAAVPARAHELDEVTQRPQRGIDGVEVGDVVAVVPVR